MNRKAFTLVELIVVITILGILAAISFLAYSGYIKSAKDSSRLSDLGSMKKSLELYILKTGVYPEPTSSTGITYSGSIIWNQGTFGGSLNHILTSLSHIPVDPLTGNEYTYSVLNTQKEYELGAIIEGELSYSFVDKASANGTELANAYVTGDYNGKVAQVKKDDSIYFLAAPSIISTESGDYETIVTGNKIVYNGYSNLPNSYSDTKLKLDGSSDKVFVKDPLIMSVTDTSELTVLNNDDLRIQFLEKLQNSYSGTTLSTNTNFKEVLDVNTSVVDDELKEYANKVVEEVLKLNVEEVQRVIVKADFLGYIQSEILGWFKKQISINGKEVSGYAYSETIGWVCFDSSCGAEITRNDVTGVLTGYALSETIGWIKVDGVKLKDDGTTSGYGQSEVAGYIKF